MMGEVPLSARPVATANRREVSTLGLHYRYDVLEALKEKGWNSGRLRAENAEARARGEKAPGLSEDTIQRLRKHNPISWANIENVCKKLQCQPGDFLEYTEDETTTPGED